jgi:hemoglobin/transferrin/lactoferrin receptor protein
MRRHLLGMFAATTLVVLANPAAAQDAAENPAAGDGHMLDPITVYATLSPIQSFDYPGQVTVVDSERIEDLQAGSIADVFKGVPGAVVDGGPRRSGMTPTIRGQRGEDVLILLDGVRQSFVSGHDGRVFIEPDLLKQVEIVKGPISALYGSGALGGVVALQTMDASDFLEAGETAGVRIKAGYQSVNDEYVVTSTGFMRSDDGKVDALASFSYRDGGDIELGNGETLQEDEQIASGLVKTNVQLSPDMKFTATWIHYRDDALDPQNPQGNEPAGSSNPLVNRTVTSDTVIGQLAYALADNPWIDGKLTTYWSRNTVEEDEVVLPRLTSREVDTLGVKADNRSRFDLSEWGKVTLTYGAEYSQDEQTGSDSASTDGTRGGVPDATATYAGVFTQAEWKIANPEYIMGELTILPGVRFDRFTNEAAGEEDFSDTAISPKLGISYKPVPWLMVFGNYGEAFRAPSFNELYADGIHFQIPLSPELTAVNNFIANPDLRPQDGSTIEAGIGFEFNDVAAAGDRFSIKGSYWRSKVNNFIDLDVNGVSPPTDMGCFIPPFTGCFTQYVNVPKAELDGIEIAARYDIGQLYGIATFATIDGKDVTTGDYLGVLEPTKFYLDFGVRLPEVWSRIGTRLTFAGDMRKVNAGELPRDGYNTVDLYAVFEPGEGPLKGFRLDLGVDNIFDEDYEVIAAGVSEPGINFKAAVGWTQKW